MKICLNNIKFDAVTMLLSSRTRALLMHPPLIIVELLLHQKQVGLELVPLKDDVAHLLLGEARLVGILVVAGRLGRQQ